VRGVRGIQRHLLQCCYYSLYSTVPGRCSLSAAPSTVLLLLLSIQHSTWKVFAFSSTFYSAAAATLYTAQYLEGVRFQQHLLLPLRQQKSVRSALVRWIHNSPEYNSTSKKIQHHSAAVALSQ
jgi:hypothetical protein